MSRGQLALALALATVVVVVTACTGTVPAQPTAAAAPPSGATNAVSKEDASLNLSGTLRIGYRRDTPTFDPHRSPTTVDNIWLFMVYDRLVRQDTKGNVVPALAERWEFSQDGLTLTMHLRSGVTFSDGTAFDASVAKLNLERARGD